MFTNISQKKILKGKIIEVSSILHNQNIELSQLESWCSEKRETQQNEYIVFEYSSLIAADFIEIHSPKSGNNAFPEDFRLEISSDGTQWQVLHTESNFTPDNDSYHFLFPLINFRYLKIFISKTRKTNEKYYAEVGSIDTGIWGASKVTGSSSSDDTHTPAALIDGNSQSYWESAPKDTPQKEEISFNLGRVFPVYSIILSSSGQEKTGFPKKFHIETSPDQKIWTPFIEEKNFVAEAGTSYAWHAKPINAQYIKIECDSPAIEENNYSVRLAAIEILTLPSWGNADLEEPMLPYASIFEAGIARLAKNGDTTPSTVVQANDQRLAKSSTTNQGVVQLAENNSYEQGLAVQASDDRLKPATETREGIVRLGYDRENKAGIAVQGNDSRLNEATENSFGIVKLCPDNKYSELSVVKGSDSRLQHATAASFGICRLASNGEQEQGCVVQGNDRRLKNATTTAEGIVLLAKDGETQPDTVVQGNDKRLKKATTTSHGIVELAENGEDKPGVVVQGSDKRLKNASTSSKGIVELAEDGENKPGVVVQGSDKRLKNASTSSKGIVELAEDGEDNAGVVIQGNDKRLKNASTTAKGIVELAENGEDNAGVVVQGNDKRLKNASTVTKGIVELAEDGENKPGVVVQGDDSRLKGATENHKGIMRFAADGESSSHTAVQGSDKRLKDATTSSKGIVELAENGEDIAGVVVQGNDKRLKDATENSKGIMRFSGDGEDAPLAAVQGNDKRLKNATTFAKGIVELAEDGENKEGVAMQGHDKRLKKATTDSYGIVRLAKNGEEREHTVVVSNDERLSNPRQPLPHEHDYAPKDHAYNDHSGTIHICKSMHQPFNGIVPPPDNATVIYGENKTNQPGNIGVAGVVKNHDKIISNSYGVLGHSSFVGVRGQTAGNTEQKEKGCGVLGLSRFGAGGVFVSEHDYSLVVDGFGNIDTYDTSTKLIGNGQALAVHGSSDFQGTIRISNPAQKDAPANITEMFEIDDEEYISPGDLLVVSAQGNSLLSRTRKSYDSTVIGIVSGNPAIIVNNSGKDKKVYPIILTGKALCKVDARISPIKPGDLIVTSETPGCGMKGTIDSFEKIGTVIGKALTGLENEVGIIPIFITHA
jgi:hypothetical protein